MSGSVAAMVENAHHSPGLVAEPITRRLDRCGLHFLSSPRLLSLSPPRKRGPMNTDLADENPVQARMSMDSRLRGSGNKKKRKAA